MTVYNAGSINGVGLVQSINGVDIESIEEINVVWIEHIPLRTVIYYHGTISDAASKTTEVSFMLGWYVCNGKTTVDGTPPDYIDVAPRFLRCSAGIDDTGGGNDIRSVLNHTHSTNGNGSHSGIAHSYTGYSGTHRHTINKDIVRYGSLKDDAGYQSGSYMHTYDAGEFLFLGGDSPHEHTVGNDGGHSNHSISNQGTATPNNRPAYKTLIPLIRLRRDNYTFAVGTILWFDGSFTNGNGWYKCDGNNGTLNLLNSFIRCEPTSSGSGGTDTTLNVQHNHSNSTAGSHNHDCNYDTGHVHYYDTACWGSSGANNITTADSGAIYQDEYVATNSVGNHSHSASGYYNNSHTHTTNSTGSGDGDNRPAFYSMQLVQRVS